MSRIRLRDAMATATACSLMMAGVWAHAEPQDEGGTDETATEQQQVPFHEDYDVNYQRGSVTISTFAPDIKTTEWGWEAAVGYQALNSAAIADGTIYIGGGFGTATFYAYALDGSTSRWAASLSDIGPSAPTVQDGKVIFNTESCTLFVMDAETGTEVWSRWLGDPLTAEAVASNSVVFMAFPENESYMLAAMDTERGATLWRTALDADILSTPVVANNALFLTTHSGTVYRFDAETGEEMWRTAAGATSAPRVEG